MNLTSSLNLSSQSPLQKQQLRKVKTIVQLLQDNSDSSQFRQPVNWQELELLDYPLIIKNPIDLGTIKARMQKDHYHFVEQILDDIQRIWDNCKLYNQNGSWIHSLADKMDKYYKKLLKNYFSHLPIPNNNTKSTQSVDALLPTTTRISRATSKKDKNDNGSSNQKYKLMDQLKRLSKQNLGKIVQIILQGSPQSYTFIEQNYCQINMEVLQPHILQEIQEKVNQIKQTEDKFTKKVKL